LLVTIGNGEQVGLEVTGEYLAFECYFVHWLLLWSVFLN